MNALRYRILLVDDHPIVRQGIRLLLAGEQRFEVCAEASNWQEALDAVAACTPDAVVLDISLRERMGLLLIQEMVAIVPHLRVLILSMHDELVYAERAIVAGAHGYVMKTDAAQNVLEALDRVLAGGIYLGTRVAGLLLGRALHPSKGAARSGIESLTNRELEVLSLIGTGLSSDSIATRLSLSVKTIEAHRGNIRCKLGLETGESLLELALRYTRDLRS